MTTTAAYDWEAAYREDPRTLAIQAALDRILVTSFPGVAARLAKAAPPVKQESARAAPAVKPEQREPERQELDATVYLTESSSDVDSQAEIDPKEALRELEAKAVAAAAAAAQRDVAMADERDDEPAGSADEEDDAEDEDEEPTACAVCRKSDNEKQILLCDGCDAEYHMYCLRPPLTAVPPGDWFCPACAATRAASSAPADPEAMDVDDEPLSDALIRIKQEKMKGFARASSNGDQVAATSVSIAQTFETDVANSNALLIHACQCDAPRCADATFREFCPLMKRYLRSACWGSHNDKWVAYRIATATAELFAYHSLHCQAGPGCNVPLCDELRAEEYV